MLLNYTDDADMQAQQGGRLTTSAHHNCPQNSEQRNADHFTHTYCLYWNLGWHSCTWCQSLSECAANLGLCVAAALAHRMVPTTTSTVHNCRNCRDSINREPALVCAVLTPRLTPGSSCFSFCTNSSVRTTHFFSQSGTSGLAATSARPSALPRNPAACNAACTADKWTIGRGCQHVLANNRDV